MQLREENEVQMKVADGGGNRFAQERAGELNCRGDKDPIVQVMGSMETTNQGESVNCENEEGNQEPLNTMGLKWVKATGSVKSTKTTETKSWAEIVKSNRYEVLDVVDLDKQSSKEEQTGEKPEPSHRYKQKVSGSKVGSAQSFINGCPSLKLSRLLWPTHKPGKKERLSRVKRIARHALERESLRDSKFQKDQQVFDCTSIYSESEESVASPKCHKRETSVKGKAVQTVDNGTEQGINKVWVRKDVSTEKSTKETWNGPPGFEPKAGDVRGVNFAQLIDQECYHLRSVEEVNEWVGKIIDPLTK
ncbi:hypothetical protein FRX31_021111 [Thalictrum thalictroides]|uniref:Uncharacterized protein n=1 Tax=Thalictrum thalictroides TaxID=46969 RepID=A0A7J6VWU1_THATH|nr:hypothetical protein FRX31_021111 [Thalictrum thalictroides]